MDDDVTRIHDFERAMLARVSRRIEPFDWGTAYLDDRFPKRWDSNFLWIERSLDGVDAEELVAEADRVLGGAGLEHRELAGMADADGERLAPGLAALGWETDHLVAMVHRREPDRWSDDLAEEVDLATARPALLELGRRQPWGKDDPDAVRSMADYRGVLVETIGARFFAVTIGRRVASLCELYTGDGVGQIEDVSTFEEDRGRGYARAVVLAAVRAAREAGCDLLYLRADEADWPKHLYAKLGFDPVERTWSFLKRPALGDPAPVRGGG
jgi:GNAT superfamily N-acetyltransferase